MTAGHARAILDQIKECNPEHTIIQIDEYHFQSPDQLFLVHAFLEAGFKLVLSTATPTLRVDATHYGTYRANLSRRFNITTLPLRTDPCLAFDSLLRSDNARAAGYSDRVLIIHPSIKECSRIFDAIQDRSGMFSEVEGRPFSIAKLSSVDRRVPRTGHIVATQMVDAGVTIKGVSCVIDCGVSMVSHMHTLQSVLSSQTVHIQRKGRTGRDRHGLYIPLLDADPNSDPLELPTNWDLLHNFETYQAIYRHRTILRSEIIKPTTTDQPRLRVNDFARLGADIPIEAITDSTSRTHFIHDLNIYLQVLLLYSNTLKEDDMYNSAARSYNSINGNPTQDVEHLHTRGVRTSAPVRLLEEYVKNDGVLWHTILGPRPGIPRWTRRGLALAPFQETMLPGVLPRNFTYPQEFYTTEVDDALAPHVPAEVVVDEDEGDNASEHTDTSIRRSEPEKSLLTENQVSNLGSKLSGVSVEPPAKVSISAIHTDKKLSTGPSSTLVTDDWSGLSAHTYLTKKLPLIPDEDPDVEMTDSSIDSKPPHVARAYGNTYDSKILPEIPMFTHSQDFEAGSENTTSIRRKEEQDSASPETDDPNRLANYPLHDWSGLSAHTYLGETLVSGQFEQPIVGGHLNDVGSTLGQREDVFPEIEDFPSPT